MNKNDRDLRRQYLLKMRFLLCHSSKARIRFIRKHHLMDAIGENIMWQPHMLPMDTKMIRLHNNISIANDVSFVTHDVMYNVFDHMDEGVHHNQNVGCIEIMDNVCIGLGAILLPNVRIGPTAMVAAGSVVTKAVPEGAVVAGNPARVIGSYDAVKKKQEELLRDVTNDDRFSRERIRQAWDNFEKAHPDS